MRTRSESKKEGQSTATPKKASKDNKLKTPKSEKKKRGSETPLRVDDFLSSQHFGSQIEVGWDCNSPDALRNLQRYREHDGEVSEIVMRLLDEAPPEHLSQSPDNLTKISPPPYGLWRGPVESNRPQRKLRPRKKSGEEHSLQDALYQSLQKALLKCETISESEEQSDDGKVQGPEISKSQEVGGTCQFEVGCNAIEEQVPEEKKLLNYSRDLFESTKYKDLENEDFGDKLVDEDITICANDEHQLDKSDAAWSDEELFEDSFIIKATQFPENLKCFSSSLMGMKRKPTDENVSSKTKSPRYSFQIHAQTDVNSNTISSNLAKLNGKEAGSVLSGVKKCVKGKPPVGPSKGTCLESAINSKPILNVPKCLKSNCASGFSKLSKQKGPVLSSSLTNRTQLIESSSTNDHIQTNSENLSRQLLDSKCAPQSSSLTGSESVLCSNKQSVSNPRTSSFRKHNSFHGQETVKTASGSLTRQRSFSGAGNLPFTRDPSAKVPNQVVYNFGFENKPGQSKSSLPCSVTQSQTIRTGVPVSASRLSTNNGNSLKYGALSVQTSCRSALNSAITSVTFSNTVSTRCATVVSSACSKPLISTVNGSRNAQASLTRSERGSVSASAGSETSKLGSAPSSTYTFKAVTHSALKGKPVANNSAKSMKNLDGVTSTGSCAPALLMASVSKGSILSDNNNSHVKVKAVEKFDGQMEESPVFHAKKQLSSGAFDTSLTDELLCTLAEPDDLLDSQICDIKHDTKQVTSSCVVSYSSSSISSVSLTTIPSKSTKPGTVHTQSLDKQISRPVQNSLLPSKSNEKRMFSFKNNQKPVSGVSQGGLKLAGDQKMEEQVQSTEFKKPTDQTAVVTKNSAPVVSNKYSEDLFLSDDVFLDDDGLTEPEILAMLDEVEFLATQQMKMSQGTTKDSDMDNEGHEQYSQDQTLTPTKYSPTDIEKKKAEALRRREKSRASQKLTFSQDCEMVVENYSSPEKVDHSSQDKPVTPTKVSPSDIEKKRMEPLKKRQSSKTAQQLFLNKEPTSCIAGHSPSKSEPLSQGHSSSQSSSDKDVDNSQGSLPSPIKYSPSEIERKRQEALRRRELSLSQESNAVQGHSPTKDIPMSQGQNSDQRSEGEAANSAHILSSPVKYSQLEIERKKQEALKRRRLKLTSAQVKTNKASNRQQSKMET